MVRPTFVLCCALAIAACGPSGGGGTGGSAGNTGGAGGSSGSGGAGGTGGSGGSAFFGSVYAHSPDTLFKVDPDTFALTMVGPFIWPTGTTDQMTDIALDRNANMVGVSFTKVYSVNVMTAQTTFLSNVQGAHEFNGLSFIPPQGPDPNLPEILVGTTLDGSVWQINPMTGATMQIGAYGGDLTSSGDLVSVSGFGTYATVKHGTTGPDFVARLDPTTWAATIVSPTSGSMFQDIWGLGFWKGKLYGFTDGMQFILIDPSTGVGTLQQMATVQWWGAGVTTSAPVVP